jgi:hypothetical protein
MCSSQPTLHLGTQPAPEPTISSPPPTHHLFPPKAGSDPVLLEPLPALLACARRLAALQPPDGEGPPEATDGSEMSAGMSSQAPALRAEQGLDSSCALQARGRARRRAGLRLLRTRACRRCGWVRCTKARGRAL